MGGGRTKRKSEGTLWSIAKAGPQLIQCSAADLPPAKKHARRAEQKEQDEVESSHAEEGSSDNLFIAQKPTKVKPVKKPISKSRKSEPVKRLERSDDAEDNEGGLLESQ